MRRGTYSIVARDPETGEVGAAVQSHWFGVGPIVPWVRPGVGAVGTQSVAEAAYGPRMLDLLAEGRTPQEALPGPLGGGAVGAARRPGGGGGRGALPPGRRRGRRRPRRRPHGGGLHRRRRRPGGSRLHGP